MPAIADVLFGKVNPSGRLAMTFPASLESCPTFESFHDDENGLFYREEELFGYRAYQHQGIATAYREHILTQCENLS
jgi:beta-glucosidase